MLQSGRQANKPTANAAKNYSIPLCINVCSGLIVTLSGRYTLSGSTGKVVASHAEIPRSGPGLTEAIFMHCALVALRGYCPVKGGGGKGQSIGSTVSDAIVRSWLWSTATGSRPLGYLGNITTSS